MDALSEVNVARAARLALHAGVGCLVCAAVSAAAPPNAMAQEATTPDQEAAASRGKFGPARRQALYERVRLEPTRMMLNSAMLPGLGSIKSDRVFKGLLFMSTFAMSAFVTVNGVIREDRIFAVGGGVAAGVIYTTSIASAYFDARRFNRELRQRYKVEEFALSPSPNGLVLTVRW